MKAAHKMFLQFTSYILDPKLFVSILTFRVLKCQFSNKICIFSLWQVQNWKITYQLFTKKYTYGMP